jgi:hypothetical protein
VRGFVLAAFVCVVVGGSIFLFNASTLVAFIPVVLAFAAAYFVRLLTDARLPGVLNRSMMTGAVILLVMPLLSSLYFNQAGAVQPHAEADLMQRVAQGVPIYADRAQEVAWYSGRTTVWLPDSEKDIQEMGKRTKFAAIYLSSATPSYRGELGGWATVYREIGVPAAQYIRSSGNTARMPYISKGIFAGFAPFRGMTREEDAQYLARGSLLLLREEALPKSVKK